MASRHSRTEISDPPFTLEQAAAYYQTTTRVVRTWIEQGLLPAARLGSQKHWRVQRADLDAMFERCRVVKGVSPLVETAAPAPRGRRGPGRPLNVHRLQITGARR